MGNEFLATGGAAQPAANAASNSGIERKTDFFARDKAISSRLSEKDALPATAKAQARNRCRGGVDHRPGTDAARLRRHASAQSTWVDVGAGPRD